MAAPVVYQLSVFPGSNCHIPLTLPLSFYIGFIWFRGFFPVFLATCIFREEVISPLLTLPPSSSGLTTGNDGDTPIEDMAKRGETNKETLKFDMTGFSWLYKEIVTFLETAVHIIKTSK